MRPMKDPAPSRLAYRLNRLMLTRRFRVFLRFGLPALLLASGVAWWASDVERRDAAMERVAELKREVQERPEFMVRMMAVGEVSAVVEADVRATLALDFPVSSFDLDLDALRTLLEEIDAIRTARLQIRQGGVLDVEIEERQPVVVWRREDVLTLLDAEGHRVASLGARNERVDLPLIAGDGAQEQVAEALQVFGAADKISARLRGLVRVGKRRWDVVLDRDQRILLPENDPVTALEKVIALDQAQDLLARDIGHVDFRNPSRPVVRLTPDAISSLHDSAFSSFEDQQE